MINPRILKIARMGHPILSQKAQEVPFYNENEPWSLETLQIIADMKATMEDVGPASGLAAPQVFISQRIVLYKILKERSRGTLEHDIPLTIMINPKIEILSPETTLDWEACFSAPELVGEVSRYKHIKVHYWGIDGTQVTEEISDFQARVVQHECDHLDGILYPQRMTNITRLAFQEEVLKYLRDPNANPYKS